MTFDLTPPLKPAQNGVRRRGGPLFLKRGVQIPSKSYKIFSVRIVCSIVAGLLFLIMHLYLHCHSVRFKTKYLYINMLVSVCMYICINMPLYACFQNDPHRIRIMIILHSQS